MKKLDHLKFTDYEFDQNGSHYKVNTDTAFLGMFLDKMVNKSVLDIGTNTGALLLYAKYHGARELNGVDIHEDALIIAKRNLKKYSDEYKLYHTRIQDFEHEPFDVVICNPPFFEMNNVFSVDLHFLYNKNRQQPSKLENRCRQGGLYYCTFIDILYLFQYRFAIYSPGIGRIIFVSFSPVFLC